MVSRKRIPFSPPPGTALECIDPAVEKYNAINSALCRLLPATARAYVTIAEVLPLMKAMQALLSQRPKAPTHETVGFELLRVAGVSIAAIPITHAGELPGWSFWLASWAHELDYSVRHLRRLIFEERAQKKKFATECGWSGSDHTVAANVAILGLSLAKAVRAGGETGDLVDEIMRLAERRLPDPDWQKQVARKKRPARRTMEEGFDLGQIA